MHGTLITAPENLEKNEEQTFVTTAPTANPINLWLVDDNHRLRTTLAELFGHCEGIRCTATFHSPNAVLSTLASKVGPDVILLDMHMGDANGLDVIRPIKSLSRTTQVLMLTTFFDSEAETRALRSGASGFLLKSFPMEKILHSIRQAWSHPTPHLKRSSCQRPPAPNVDSAPQAPVVASHDSSSAGAGERSRKRLLWVKHCLDLIRNSRN